MRGLWKKDILILKNQYKTIIVLLAIGLLNGVLNSIAFMFMFTTFILMSLALSTITYDQENNGLKYMFSLPVNKNKYVLEKYLLALILIVISIGICFMVSLSLPLINPNMTLANGEVIFSIVLTIVFCLLYCSLLLPLYLKWGVEKSRVYSFITVGLLILMLLLITNVPLFSNSTSFILLGSVTSLCTMIIGFSLIIFFTSMIISKRIIVI